MTRWNGKCEHREGRYHDRLSDERYELGDFGVARRAGIQGHPRELTMLLQRQFELSPQTLPETGPIPSVLPQWDVARFEPKRWAFKAWKPELVKRCPNCDQIIEVGHYLGLYWQTWERLAPVPKP